jgi:hypothetical protein
LDYGGELNAVPLIAVLQKRILGVLRLEPRRVALGKRLYQQAFLLESRCFLGSHLSNLSALPTKGSSERAKWPMEQSKISQLGVATATEDL